MNNDDTCMLCWKIHPLAVMHASTDHDRLGLLAASVFEVLEGLEGMG